MIRHLAFAALLIAAPAQAAGWRETVTAFAKDNFHHPAWGASHSRRDYALAKQMAAADGMTLDDDVLVAASFLHDRPRSSHGASRAPTIPMPPPTR